MLQGQCDAGGEGVAAASAPELLPGRLHHSVDAVCGAPHRGERSITLWRPSPGCRQHHAVAHSRGAAAAVPPMLPHTPPTAPFVAPLPPPPNSYGSSPEVKVIDSTGRTSMTKWRTLGRISHESALVMPNLKTVYTTDDNPNGGEE